MSRVARKRLEKEAKRKNRKLLFGMNKAKSADTKTKDTKIVDEVPKKENLKQNKVNSAEGIEKTAQNNSNLNSESSAQNKGSKKSFKATSFERGDTMVAKPQKMKTADKIISVEDERMYYERKQNRIKKGLPAEDSILTVGDIHTAEEEGDDVENTVKNEPKPEKNINEIKRLNIENAPFTDVVKVAESRLEAEKEEKERKLRQQREKELREQREREKRLKEEKIRQRMEQLKREQEEDLKKNEVGKVEDKEKSTENQEALSDKDSVSKSESGTNVDENLSKKEREKRLKEQIEREKEEKLAELNSENDSEDTVKADSEVSESEVEPDETEETTNESFDGDGGSGDGGGFKRGFKKCLKIFGIAVVVIYVIGCVVFHNRFFVNTKINGMDVGFMTPAKVDKLAGDRVEGYKIIIDGRNNVKDELNGTDIDMKYISDGSINQVKKEQGFLGWPLALFEENIINGRLNVQFNNDKLKEKVKNFNIFKKENIKTPVSAYPKYDEKKKDFVIDKGDKGSTPIDSKVLSFVSDSVKSEALNTKYPDSVYLEQKNKADDQRINRAIAEMKKYTGMKVVYDFGYEKYTLDGKEISKMFNVDSENDYKVTFSKENVRNFVRSLSRKYSTYGDTRVIPSASTGGNLKVSGGIYGWLIDRDGETDALVKIIQARKDVMDRKPLYKQTAVSRDKNDLGNEFIEIDLTKQHMWFVKDGKPIVDTPIVSGNPNRGDATPPGIYPITYKTRNAVLRGPGYASPVGYWIPFNGNIGIHDASWQPVYGGSRYLYAGSHGCINTPYGKVAEIYKLSKEGMPVVVHY